MTYTKAKHDGQGGVTVERGNIIFSIPADPANSHYQELLELEAAGEITIAPYEPPTQAELDAVQQAEVDALTSQIDTGKSIIRALGVEVYLLAKTIDPTLTPATFKQRIRNRIEGF